MIFDDVTELIFPWPGDIVLIAFVAFTVVVVHAAVSDFRTRRIPYTTTIAALGLGLGIAGQASGYPHAFLIAGVVWAGMYGLHLLTVFTGRTFGGDADAMLAAAFAPLLGIAGVGWMLLGSAGAAVAHLAVTRKRTDTVAYGPYLAVAGTVALALRL